MPTLTTEEPDSYDIDYFYPKYKDHFGVFIKETDAAILKVLPSAFSPPNCETKIKNTYHYFPVPTQPTISTCICKKYHVNFTSQFYHIPTELTTKTLTQEPTPMNTSPIVNIERRFPKIKDTIPKSPIKQSTTQNLNLANTQPRILFPNYYQDPTPTAITPHSQHFHTCFLCKTKDIPCVKLSLNEQHAPDYSKCCIFKGHLLHRECAKLTQDFELALVQKKLNSKQLF